MSKMKHQIVGIKQDY